MEDTYTYNGPDLTKFVSASSGTFDFEYDDNHNMTTATNDGLVLSAQYDEAGNNTSAKLQKGSAGAYMQSSATYTADGNHPLSVTDVDGLKTQYSYDSMGRVYTVQSPYEGGSISKTITYDSGAFSRSNGSFSSGTYALSDAFENGLLSRTARKTFSGSTPNWQKYEMTRDAGGNITRIQVQTARGADAETEADELWSSPIVLARYRYPLPNLPIEQTIFGNGDSENYLADDYYRVIGSQHWSNGELEYQEALSYDSNGNQAGSVVTDGDGIEIAEYSYEYDSLGRLIRSEQSGSSVGALRTQHQYDAQNRLSSQSWQLPGHEFWEVFTYNTNGYLTKLLDRNGNAIYYLYNDNTAYNSSNKFNPSSTSWKPKANQANRITQIIQINDNGSAADLPVLVCRFQYDGEFLSRITDAGGRSYTFTYQTASSGARLLSEIGFPGDVSAFYQYSSETHLLTRMEPCPPWRWDLVKM